MTNDKKIYKALVGLEKACPELFYLVKNTKIEVTNKVPTASASITKTGFRININDSWVEKFDEFNLSALIEHELLHIVLDHCSSMKTFVNPRLANVAMDCIINDIGHHFQDKVRVNLNSDLQAGCYIEKINKEYKTNFDSQNNTALDIYTFLMSQKDNEKVESFDSGLSDESEGEGGGEADSQEKNDSQGEEEETGEGKGQADSEKVSLDEILSPEELGEIYKIYGKKSADVKKYFKDIEKREKDKRIRKAIEAFFVSHKAEVKKSLKKLNKRFSFLPYGRQKDSKQKILLALDVSGSMLSPDDLEKLKMSVNSAVNNGFQVDLIQGDTEKIGDTFKDIKRTFNFEENIRGGGGTDLKFIFDEMRVGRYDCYVIVTDGYFEWRDIPEKFKKDILFLNTTARPIEKFKNLHI